MRIARCALGQSRRILFVCRGNICRSPFAQRYAQQKFPKGWSVSSCGYYPQKGRTPPSIAVEIAEEFGVNLSDHRSAQVNREAFEEADIIFTFDGFDYEALRSLYSSARAKIYLMGTLCLDTPLVIKDPYGEGAEEFRRTYGIIAHVLDAVVPTVSSLCRV